MILTLFPFSNPLLGAMSILDFGLDFVDFGLDFGWIIRCETVRWRRDC